MSRRSNRRATQKQAAGANSVHTGDSFQNLMTRTGVGAGSQGDASTYAFSPISRNRVQLEQCYRSSWLAGASVDAYAEDMTREGVEFLGNMKPEQIEELDTEFARMQIMAKVCDMVKWGRLYGGAIAVMLVDGQDTSTPLSLDTISKGQFKGILVLDRWQIQPTLNDLVQEFGPDIGKPKFYDVLGSAPALSGQHIHYSRVIRHDGVELPYWQKISENSWGQSVLERLWDRLIPFDSVTAGAAQLVYKAHLRTYKVKGLREIVAMGGKAFEGLVKQIDLIRQYQNNEGLTLMDGDDEFEAHQYSFGGLSDMMIQFGQQISGATGIPLVRLFGQSPAGLNSTGESDIRNYYDNVKKDQSQHLGPGMAKIAQITYRSVFGKAPDKGFGYQWSPLWQMSDDQKATVATNVTTAVVGAYDSNIIDRATALKELRQSSRTTGVWSNITDDQIKEAEAEPPPTMNEELPDEKSSPDTGPEASERSEKDGKG